MMKNPTSGFTVQYSDKKLYIYLMYILILSFKEVWVCVGCDDKSVNTYMYAATLESGGPGTYDVHTSPNDSVSKS
jgi:uncharacterized membrane protein (DUF485 family)